MLSASSGAGPVTVTLNAAVSWRLDFAAGTERTVANLRGGRVAAITVAAGSDIVDLTLPRPRGTVPIRLTGGASQFLLSLPAAGEVSLDGATAGAALVSVTRWGG